jgi:hypothetical protein
LPPGLYQSRVDVLRHLQQILGLCLSGFKRRRKVYKTQQNENDWDKFYDGGNNDDIDTDDSDGEDAEDGENGEDAEDAEDAENAEEHEADDTDTDTNTDDDNDLQDPRKRVKRN